MDAIYSGHPPAHVPRTPPEVPDFMIPGVPDDVLPYIHRGRYADVPKQSSTIMLSGPALIDLVWACLAHKENVTSVQYCTGGGVESPFILSSSVRFLCLACLR